MLCALCFFLSVAIASSHVLRQVQIVHRHGDRAPLHSIPNHPVSWPDVLGVEPAQLTGTGMNQSLELGNYLKTKYVGSLLSSNYLPSEVYVRSTDVDRTLMTASLVLQSMFSSATRFNDLNNNTQLTGSMRVPVHTVAKNNNVLQAVDHCPEYSQVRLVHMTQTQSWRDKLANETEFLEWFSNETGFENVPLEEFYTFYDPVYVQYVHSQLQGELADPDKIQHIIDLADWSEYHKRHVGGELIGGPLLGRIFSDMSTLVYNHSNPLKYVQHSGHDSTMMALFAAMNLDNNTLFQKIPNYASAIIFEVYEEEVTANQTENFTITTLYRDGVSGQVTPVTWAPTTFTEFKALALQRGFMDDLAWCAACTASSSSIWDEESAPDVCVRGMVYEKHEDSQTYLQLAVGLGIGLGVSLIVMVFLVVRGTGKKGRGAETPLLR